MPIILHLDFNSFFASVEQQANPFLRGKPIAVTGKSKHSIDIAKTERGSGRFSVYQTNLARTVVTTASREAKQFGVKTAMASTEARKICPDLLMIPGDPKKYGEITHRFLGILRRHCDAVEQFSTDEAFADITFAAGDYFGAALLAQIIRDDIRREIGAHCTVSIGIAQNKLLAKLAGESIKPNGLTVIHPSQIIRFLDAQPLSAICGIGPRIEKRLHKIGITTIRGLRHAPFAKLLQEFKPHYAHFLSFASRGMGDAHILSEPLPPKSVGNSYTFAQSLQTEDEIRVHTLTLCDRIAWRMRRQGFSAQTLSVFLRDDEMKTQGMEKRFREPLRDGLDLAKNAEKLIHRLWDGQKKIRLIGISASSLLSNRHADSLFSHDRRKQKVLQALDVLQGRYGSGIWQRAATMQVELKERISGWHYDHEG